MLRFEFFGGPALSETDMSRSQENRKKAVVDKSVQYSLAARVVLHFFVFLCAGTIFGVINQFLLNPFAGVKENLGTFISNSAPFLVALICLMPVFIRDTLKLSNRIAGPIHNLRSTIKRLSEGEQDVRPLKFRKNDFWDDLPDAFNAMTKRLAQKPVTKPREQELVEV